MAEETEQKKVQVELDPLTKLAVELDEVKKELSVLKASHAEKDKLVNETIQANKRLVAELATQREVLASVSQPKPVDATEDAMKGFWRTLNITR